MERNKKYNWIPTKLSEKSFTSFILPHLLKGKRGPEKKLSFYSLFCYIMRVLSTGMKWEDLEIKKDQKGFPEIHYTSVFRAFQGWVNDGIFDKIFEASVMKLFQEKLVDCTILHGDGTNHAAKKGGDNLGFNAHKRIKGDKVVVVCDRNVNVIAPFIEAPGNRNEAILLNPLFKKNERNRLIAGFNFMNDKKAQSSLQK